MDYYYSNKNKKKFEIEFLRILEDEINTKWILLPQSDSPYPFRTAFYLEHVYFLTSYRERMMAGVKLFMNSVFFAARRKFCCELLWNIHPVFPFKWFATVSKRQYLYTYIFYLLKNLRSLMQFSNKLVELKNEYFLSYPMTLFECKNWEESSRTNIDGWKME